MTANKTKPGKASVGSFVDALDNSERRDDARTLVRFMRAATGEQPRMWGPSIIGFGSYHYVYESGREGDMPFVAFSPRKTALVLYVHAGLSGSEALLAKLGKHTRGKGCLYVKRLSDVDHEVLQQLVVKSVAAVRARRSTTNS